jgi:hypothetical protein
MKVFVTTESEFCSSVEVAAMREAVSEDAACACVGVDASCCSRRLGTCSMHDSDSYQTGSMYV